MGGVAKSVGNVVKQVAQPIKNVVKEVGKGAENAVNAVGDGVPKVTADPSKLLTNAVQGATNLQSDITGSVIGGLGTVANQALNAAGSVMSNPNAAGVLGAVGAAYGIPGMGNLGGLLGGGASATPTQSAAPMVVSQPSGDGGNNQTMLIMMGGGALLVVVVLLVSMKGKK